MITGITVTLINQVETGKDEFNNPVYEDSPVEVENVLVAPASSDDIIDSASMYGKKAVYTLAIPKGDTHTWTDQKVKFFDQIWHVFGMPVKGVEANIPLSWNMKVMVEAYEEGDWNEKSNS